MNRVCIHILCRISKKYNKINYLNLGSTEDTIHFINYLIELTFNGNVIDV